jgi:peptidoglycan/LPS O-acetylase OafA/YrhL
LLLPIDTAPDRAAATTRSGYMPALDGLRAISISLVVISHWGHGLDRIFPGLFGVVIFFVISGFLITRQLAQELAHSGTLNLRAFYRRRFFRLAPALLLYLTIFIPVLLGLGAIMTPIQIAAGVFYFANYYHLFIGYWPLSPMPILWSLSVEEHFYLLFPLCLLGFSRNVKTILPWLCVALIGVFLWRVKLYSGCSTDPAWWACGWPGIIRVYGTDAIFDCILYGCITALALHYFPARVRSLFINRAAFSVALLGVFASLVIRNPAFRETLRYSVQSGCAAILILNILFSPQTRLRAALSWPPLVLLGRLSYSLYLFHYGVLVTIEGLRGNANISNGPTDFVAYLLISASLAAASYFLVERPMVQIGRRFA